MSKIKTDNLTPYQRAAIEWFEERPGIVSCIAHFNYPTEHQHLRPPYLSGSTSAGKPDKIDRWLVINVPHYAEVFCKVLKIPVGEDIPNAERLDYPVDMKGGNHD